jgi:excisionase family DNA binding protein
MAEKDQLESVEETSRRLAISSYTVRRLVKAGHVRSVRVGRRVLIPGSEVERVIASGCGKYANGEARAGA